MQNTKCECGHQNAVGTVLCEACGKPLDEETLASDEMLEMRYDGVARRSQKANPDFVDRIWNFFSSVKVAVYLIVLTLLAASLGTVFPQENTLLNIYDKASYYEQEYGRTGAIYYALGLSNLYESWWFIGLLVLIGTSLVICSLDRVLPLYRALSKQQVRKHLQFLTRQQVVYAGRLSEAPEAWIETFGRQLKRRRYRVWSDGTAMLAEKNRFSRWGPYINHIGLIIFLLAVLARSIPGWHMDQYVSLDDQEIEPIPETNYYVKSDKFTVEYYADDELPDSLKGTNRAKLYNTRATLYECVAACDDPQREPELKPLVTHDIRVNSPLNYKGFKLYQFDYTNTIRLISVKPMLIDKKTGQAYGPFELPMRNPALTYDVGPYTLEVKDIFLDFGLDEQKRPMTKSREANAPAFVFLIKGPDLPESGEPFLYFPRDIDKEKFGQDLLNGAIAERFEFKVASMEDVAFSEYTTHLNVRVDRALPYIWTGASIFMIGLIMGLYWQHRRIWVRIDDGILTLGAHTNKNRFGLRAEVAAALAKSGVTVDPKALDNRRNSR